MHVVSFIERVTVAGVELEAGIGYVMNNTGVGSILTSRRLVKCGDGRMRPLYRLASAVPLEPRPLEADTDYNGRRIWIFRGGGFGDVMMATPMVREILRRWPQADVRFVTLPEYGPVLAGLGCQVVTGFLRVDELRLDFGAGPGVPAAADEDRLIFLEGVIEDNPEAETLHAVDLFAMWAGLPPDPKTGRLVADRRLHYAPQRDELLWARGKFPRTGRRRVAVQAAASSPVRTYPAPLLVRVIEELLERDFEVYVFGKPGQVEEVPPGATNLTRFGMNNGGLDFRLSAAVLATCDVAVVPDSALLHLAGAMNVPAVALFGSFDANLRVIPGAPVTVLQAKADCAPCFWHESGGVKFPEDGPCLLGGFCTVLASIRPFDVVNAVEALYRPGDVEYALGQDGALGAVVYRPSIVERFANWRDDATGMREVDAVYDFLSHKIGDTVAAVYLLSLWLKRHPGLRLGIVDRGALSVAEWWLDFAGERIGDVHFKRDMPFDWERVSRLNFEIGNLWIAAPSAFRDGAGELPRMRCVPEKAEFFDVGIHCLEDADYNTGRNHDRRQMECLKTRLMDAGLKVFWVPSAKSGVKVGSILESMAGCRVWIGGDTGFSHCFASMHPDRPLVAIYGDDSHDRASFEDERRRLIAWWREWDEDEDAPAEMLGPWCSDPLSRHLHRFVMRDHKFDLEAVLERVLELTGCNVQTQAAQ